MTKEVEPHGIELRKVVHYERMSEETYCGHAEMYVDGTFVGNIKNEGHGGPWSFDGDYSYWQTLDKWIGESQPRTFYDWDHADPAGYPETLDSLVSQLFYEGIVAKQNAPRPPTDLYRKLGNNIIFIGDDGKLRKVAHKRGYTREQVKERFAKARGPVRWLDDIPQSEAVEILARHFQA